MKKLNKKGFTIVELVIVIAVIAILAAVLIPTFAGVIDRANKSTIQSAARNCYTELLAEDSVKGDPAKITVDTLTDDIKKDTSVNGITISGKVITFTTAKGSITYDYENNVWSDPTLN